MKSEVAWITDRGFDDAVRTLVALEWVATAFLYELGVTWEWAEVRLLARLGGWQEWKDRPPGKIALSQGLRRRLDLLATDAILRDALATYGQLPLRIASIIGSLYSSELCPQVSRPLYTSCELLSPRSKRL